VTEHAGFAERSDKSVRHRRDETISERQQQARPGAPLFLPKEIDGQALVYLRPFGGSLDLARLAHHADKESARTSVFLPLFLPLE
jgi:hypothetical protein